MRHIKIDPRHRVQVPPRRQQKHQTRKKRAQRCPTHPGVHMVLAGTDRERNTVRYLCPVCSAAGHPPVELAHGVVNYYQAARGYGFIATGGPRIFFHISDWAGPCPPKVGIQISCRVEENARGLIGRQVQPV